MSSKWLSHPIVILNAWDTEGWSSSGRSAGPARAAEGPAEIATELGVAKSSVSLWVRDVDVRARRGRRAPRSPTRSAAQAGRDRRAPRRGPRPHRPLTEQEFLVAGAALYAGEGSKTDGRVALRQQRPADDLVLLAWLRRFFADRRVAAPVAPVPPRGPRPRRGERASGPS